MKKIIVTGATGFLGHRTALALAERGHDVTALGRNVARGRLLEDKGIRFLRCELSDLARMKQAFQGQQTVIHCAALTRPGATFEEYRVANVLGTRNVMLAIQGSSIERWIHMSTARLYDPPDFPVAIRETQPLAARCWDPFLESKRLIEVDLSNFVLVPTIILRPHIIFGPGDRRLFPYLYRFASWGYLPRFDGGDSMIDPVHVDNVVDAIAAAVDAKEEATGKAYNISNGTPTENFSFLRMLSETLGHRVDPFDVRSSRALIFAGFIEAFCRTFLPGREPFFPKYYVELFSESLSINIDEARNDLGYAPKISIRDGIAAMSARRRR